MGNLLSVALMGILAETQENLHNLQCWQDRGGTAQGYSRKLQQAVPVHSKGQQHSGHWSRFVSDRYGPAVGNFKSQEV